MSVHSDVIGRKPMFTLPDGQVVQPGPDDVAGVIETRVVVTVRHYGDERLLDTADIRGAVHREARDAARRVARHNPGGRATGVVVTVEEAC